MGFKARRSAAHADPTAASFPFVGAGAAEYFEWAELFVRFVRIPGTTEREQILHDVPPPLRDTMTWDGPLLWLASEQGVGRVIRASYAGSARKQPTPLTVQSRFAQAGASADQRFNAHIDAWLAAANAVVPILVAFRRQDWEAGGTALSEWHHASIRQTPAILAAMTEDARLADAPLMGRLVHWANEENVDVPAELQQRVSDLVGRAEQAQEAREEAERDAESAREAVIGARLRDDALASRTRPYLSHAEVLAGCDRLDAVLPKLAKRLRRLDPGLVSLSPGASEQALARAEQALGLAFAPTHRALLEVFDGGRLGDIVLLGTPDSGARGADDIVDYAVSHGLVPHWFVVARADASERVITMRAGKDSADHLTEIGQLIRSYRQLDAALDAVLKAGRL